VKAYLKASRTHFEMNPDTEVDANMAKNQSVTIPWLVDQSGSRVRIRRNGKPPLGQILWPMAGDESTPAIGRTQSHRQ